MTTAEQQALIDAWSKSDGGSPEDFDAIITNPQFFVDPESEYHADKLRFGFELVPDIDGDSTELVDFLAQIKRDAWERAINVGSLEHWSTGDGTTADHGGNGRFHTNSGMFAFTNSLFQCEGALDAIVSRGHLPTDAAAYEGLRVRIGFETVKGGGDIGDYQRMIVTAFNGVVEEAPKKKAPAKKKAGLSAETRAEIDALADGFEEYEEFETAAKEKYGDDAEAWEYVTSEADDGAWNLAAERAG